jgi:uncharacterized membrane protein YbaN (DUF454 family)
MGKKSFRNYLLLFIGLTAVCLGFIGIFVPLLPTTPFLLLAAACFVRSSERFYNWLTSHKWFGTYIRNYRECGAIALSGKIGSMVILWGVIGYAAVFEVTNLLLRVLLGAIGGGVSIHLLRLKTFRREMAEESAPKALSRTEIPEPMP